MTQLQLHPRLIEVDPQLIKLNAKNPRKHRGTELLRLKKSIADIGIVQIPTVRDVSGGFFECIDGEGRIQAAKEAQQKLIWVVCIGVIDDHDALTMLQAANVVRSFDLLGECGGLANLHRQGDTIAALADRFKVNTFTIGSMVAIGYFPEELQLLIRDDIARSEENTRWTLSLLKAMLPLRQELPGKGVSHDSIQDQVSEGVYDYTEVRRAIEKVLQGEITDATKMMTYAAERRFELYQQRFNKELQAQLTTSLARAKQELEASLLRQSEDRTNEKVQHYADQSEKLQKQYDKIKKQYDEVVREVAKRPEIVAAREKELEEQMLQLEEERAKFRKHQQQILEDEKIQKLRLDQETKRQLEIARQEQRAAMDQRLVEERAQWEDHYCQKEKDLQRKADATIHQIIVTATKHLTDSQLSVLYLLTPEVFNSLESVRKAEKVGLLAQLQAVRETLEMAEEQFLQSEYASAFTERR